MRNNNNKGSRSYVNKHELVYGESSSNARDAPNVCLSFVLLLTIFLIVVTQKLVLQQSKNVTACVRKPYCPLLVFNSPCLGVCSTVFTVYIQEYTVLCLPCIFRSIHYTVVFTVHIHELVYSSAFTIYIQEYTLYSTVFTVYI